MKTTLLLAMALSRSLLAQQITVSGVVTAADSVPLSGVGVRVLATGVQAFTNTDGRYSLTAASNGVLGFSSPGRRPVQQLIDGRQAIDVVMELGRGWWAAIPRGRQIRIAAGDQTYEGPFDRLSAERIVITTPGGSESIRVGQIDSLWEYAPATDRGVRIGALTGATFLATLLYVRSKNWLCGGARCHDHEPAAIALGGATVGAVVGGFVGAALGKNYQTWKRVHP